MMLKRIFAAWCLFVLLAENGGYALHIFTEDPQRYAGYYENQLPDNESDSGVAALCLVDDYYFFPFLEDIPNSFEFYFKRLAVLLPEATRSKCCVATPLFLLRAPPVA